MRFVCDFRVSGHHIKKNEEETGNSSLNLSYLTLDKHIISTRLIISVWEMVF